jgi:hypothetical protein
LLHRRQIPERTQRKEASSVIGPQNQISVIGWCPKASLSSGAGDPEAPWLSRRRGHVRKVNESPFHGLGWVRVSRLGSRDGGGDVIPFLIPYGFEHCWRKKKIVPKDPVLASPDPKISPFGDDSQSQQGRPYRDKTPMTRECSRG